MLRGIACGPATLALAALPAACLVAAPAHAQRADQNAATQSSDAFGRSVGSERSGLYSGEEVRGFNPGEAGNVRMEGLYFDQIGFLSARLTEGNTVRVGIAAQRFPFPAPSGLIDHKLALPRGEAEMSFEIDNAGSIARGLGLVAEIKLPIDGERLAVSAGVGIREATRPEGGQHRFRTYGAIAAFRPAPGTELLLLSSGTYAFSLEARPTYFPAATALPPQVPRGRFLGLDWTESDNIGHMHGAMAKVALGSGWRLHAGLFRLDREQRGSFADLLLGVTPEGQAASRVVIADDNVRDVSLSGEFRLIREWHSQDFAHALTLSLRGRSKNRLFGGSRSLSLGPGSILATEGWRRPDYTLPPQSRDRVRQIAAGAAYNLVWQGRLSLDVGLSQGRYTKRIDFADPALADPLVRDRPFVWNVSGSFAVTDNVLVFAGLSRGQEDALIAPEIAVNRAEAPAAIRTRQVEAGLRFGLADNLSLVVGAFEITRPYYNLDPALRYRELGQLSMRGLEVSLTGKLAPGLSVVGGMLLSDPRISVASAESGVIGTRPVGQVRRRIAANLDWRSAAGKGPLSLDLYLEAYSSRIGNIANTLSAPPRASVNIGARYRFGLGSAKFVLRPQVLNLFDDYGWQVSSSGGFTYTNRRTFAIALLADL